MLVAARGVSKSFCEIHGTEGIGFLEQTLTAMVGPVLRLEILTDQP